MGLRKEGLNQGVWASNQTVPELKVSLFSLAATFALTQ